MTTQTLGFLWATALGLALIPGFVARLIAARQPLIASVQPSGTSCARPFAVSRSDHR